MWAVCNTLRLQHSQVRMRITHADMCPLLCLQEEARKLNSEETAEEERKSKLPANFEARKARAEWEESVEKAKKVCWGMLRPAYAWEGGVCGSHAVDASVHHQH